MISFTSWFGKYSLLPICAGGTGELFFFGDPFQLGAVSYVSLSQCYCQYFFCFHFSILITGISDWFIKQLNHAAMWIDIDGNCDPNQIMVMSDEEEQRPHTVSLPQRQGNLFMLDLFSVYVVFTVYKISELDKKKKKNYKIN